MADKGRKTLVMSDRPKDRVTISMNAAKDRPTAFMGVEDDSRSSVVISEKSVIGEYTVERVIAEIQARRRYSSALKTAADMC